MKTYLLRKTNAVEPQTPARPRPADPVASATAEAILGPLPPPPVAGPVLFIGLDVHTDSIAVSLAPSGTTEVRRYGLIGGTHDDVLQLARKLAAGPSQHRPAFLL